MGFQYCISSSSNELIINKVSEMRHRKLEKMALFENGTIFLGNGSFLDTEEFESVSICQFLTTDQQGKSRSQILTYLEREDIPDPNQESGIDDTLNSMIKQKLISERNSLYRVTELGITQLTKMNPE